MKNLFFLVIALLFFGCKKDSEPKPDIDAKAKGIKEFSVPGIQGENILLLKDLIIIKLPSSYSSNIIKPMMKLYDGYTMSVNLTKGFEYEGKNIQFDMRYFENTYHYTVVVVPQRPIQLPSNSRIYNLTIQEKVQVRLPISISGTLITANDSGEIFTTPQVIFKNKATNATISDLKSTMEFDSAGKQFLRINIPVTASDGEYEAILEWGNTTMTLPDQFIINYGKININYNPQVIKGTASINFTGYNIFPDDTYELLLENDFIKTRKITMIRKDYNSLEMAIPIDLPTGSYKSRILINGKELETNGQLPYSSYAGFHLRTNAEQPILDIVSQMSHKKTFGQYSIDYFEESSSISKKEELIANVLKFSEYGEKLRLKLINTTTKQEYLLTDTNNTYCVMDAFQCFFGFNIKEIPDGQYEAYAVLGAKPQVSEKYPKILTIGQ